MSHHLSPEAAAPFSVAEAMRINAGASIRMTMNA